MLGVLLLSSCAEPPIPTSTIIDQANLAAEIDVEKKDTCEAICEDVFVEVAPATSTEDTLPKNPNEKSIYIVQTGDTFYSISRKLNVKVGILRNLNPNRYTVLNAGDTIYYKR